MRYPDPQQRQQVDPPEICRGCGDALAQATDAGTAWSQIWDVKVIRSAPSTCCRGGAVAAARPPSRCRRAGGIVNAHLIEIVFGQAVSVGFVDRANARLAQRLAAAGFGEARCARLCRPSRCGPRTSHRCR